MMAVACCARFAAAAVHMCSEAVGPTATPRYTPEVRTDARARNPPGILCTAHNQHHLVRRGRQRNGLGLQHELALKYCHNAAQSLHYKREVINRCSKNRPWRRQRLTHVHKHDMRGFSRIAR